MKKKAEYFDIADLRTTARRGEADRVCQELTWLAWNAKA